MSDHGAGSSADDDSAGLALLRVSYKPPSLPVVFMGCFFFRELER